MSKRYTEEYKNTIVELYNSGKILSELNSEYGLPKSTILTWVKKAKPIAVDNNKIITQADYQSMLKKMARIEEENEILKKAMAIFAKK
ncbi:transposase [[Clostridium] ultunense Esp]|uniref:Transposase n=1 Tax=[Clostridium] ultunense Esp TaxID=1288971 RepID=A0A1M4PT46_9FIRM|nr:transposase [[Clostridium] ultunense Esp]